MKLRVENLEKHFGEKIILNRVNFQFEQGKIYGLVGGNSVGKTTFFDCIHKDSDFENGRLSIEEHSGTIRELELEDVGYVLAQPIIPDFLTGREFIQFFLDIYKRKNTISRTIDEYFSLVNIDEDDQNKLIKEYSHMMKNKMLLLIHIIAEPAVLLFDEPFTSYDDDVKEMQNLLKTIQSKYIIILSTHSIEYALEICDEIVLLHNGELTRVQPDELTNENLALWN